MQASVLEVGARAFSLAKIRQTSLSALMGVTASWKEKKMPQNRVTNTSVSAGQNPKENQAQGKQETEAVTNVRQLGETKSEMEGVSAGALLGYARVSRDDQNLDRQLDALREAGCTRIFTDEGVSGARASRPGLDEMLMYVRPGDTVVIQALDRLGRRTSELLRLVEAWKAQGIGI